MSDLSALAIAPPAGAPTPLAQLATVNEALGPTQIEHLDGKRVITTGANAQDVPVSAANAGIAYALAGRCC